MADCGPNCTCSVCCVAPTSYTDAEFARKSNAPGLVMATPDAFPIYPPTGNYPSVSAALKGNILPQDKYTNDEIDSVIQAINDNVVPLFVITPTTGSTSAVVIAAATAPTDFPELADKIKTTPFNRVEVSNFLNDYYITPIAAVAIARSNPRKMAAMLNAFFNIAMAGIALCAFLQAPFGIMKLVDDLKQLAVDLLDSAKAFVDGVVTTAKEIVEKIKKFVEEAKKVVDDIIESVKAKLENVAETFKQTIDKLKQEGLKLGQHFKAMAQKFTDMVDDVKTFFSEQNAEDLKTRIETAITKAAQGFGQLTKDIVDQLLFVFCGITTDIEKQLNAPVDEVKEFGEKFQEAVEGLKAIGNNATNEAVEAGRPAATPESIAQQCQTYANEVNNSAPTGELPNIVYTPEYTNMPAPGDWSNLKFVPHITNHSFFTQKRRVYITDYTAAQVGPGVEKDERGRLYVDLPHPAYPPDTQYRGMKLETLEKANQVAKQLGVTFTITSAFRPYVHQQYLRQQNPSAARRGRIALHSQHSQGTALDITKSGWNVAQVTRAMRAIGFGGVGTYSSFMHYDLGPVRSW